MELWRAADGKGVLYPKTACKIKIYSAPDAGSKVQDVVTFSEDDFMPPVFGCLGVENGFYKVSYDLTGGYIKAEDNIVWNFANMF